MKKTGHLSFLVGTVVATFLLQGCYTQLAVSHRVVEHRYVSPRAEASTDTVLEEVAPPDTVIHEHYWAGGSYYDPWTWYDPFYDPGFHFSLRYTWGDPFWHPWCYRSYDPYWSWWGGPYWVDPYYSWYQPWYYTGYGYGYGYPYSSWYWARYDYVDPTPRNKRDWERRGADLTDRAISRPSTSAVPQESQPVAIPGSMVRAGSSSKGNARSVERRQNRPTGELSKGRKQVKRTASRPDVRRGSGKKQKSEVTFAGTVIRILGRVAQSSSKGRGGTVSRRRSSSGGSGHSVRSAPKRSSSSVSRGRSHRSSSGGGKSSRSSRRSSGGKSKR